MPTTNPNRLLALLLAAGLTASISGCSQDKATASTTQDKAQQPAATEQAPKEPVIETVATLQMVAIEPAADNYDGVAAYAVIDGEKAEVPDIQMGDHATIERILDEGKNRNRVMDQLTYLCNEIGPRLTGSSKVEEANNWTADQFRSWGLENVSLFEWGTIPVRFDRHDSTGRVVIAKEKKTDDGIQTVYDTLHEMEFTWLAWARGTDGPVRGQIVKLPETEEDFAAVKDDLAGAWVLLEPDYVSGRRGIRGVGSSMGSRLKNWHNLRLKLNDPEAYYAKFPHERPAPDDGFTGKYFGKLVHPRYPDGFDLEIMLIKNDDGNLTASVGFGGGAGENSADAEFDKETGQLSFTWDTPRGASRYELAWIDQEMTGTATNLESNSESQVSVKRDAPKTEETETSVMERVLAAGPAGFISSSKDDRVWTSAVSGWKSLNYNDIPQDVEVSIRQQDYDFIVARMSQGAPIEVEFDLNCDLIEGPIPVYNTIAEIPGTVWPDEVIIVSGHLDSWNGIGSQGTTDNGTGSSVTLEAARILMAADAKPKRTIRFILWTGEEQGLLGARAYVKSLSTEEKAKISAVFVDDGGTNYEGGLQCIESMIPMLAAATAPTNGHFYDDVEGKWMNVDVQTNRQMPRGGGSDHAAFNAVGIPGFFWDEIGRANYRYGWHTQNDKLDLAIPEYLAQSSTNAAITAYNLACAPTMLPRQLKKEESESNQN